MILDELSSRKLLSSWSWLLGNQCIAFMTTGFGDVLFWKPNVGVHFLGVQRAEIEFVDSEVQWVIEEFLADPNIIDQVLRKDYFEEIVDRYNQLNYGDVFILEPWLMLGGEDKPQNYDIGKFGVYLDLVGQAHQQNR